MTLHKTTDGTKIGVNVKCNTSHAKSTPLKFEQQLKQFQMYADDLPISMLRTGLTYIRYSPPG